MDRRGRIITLARLALLWEEAWPRLALILAVIGGFAALALLDIPRHLPVWLHGLLLGAAIATVAVLVLRLARLRTPTAATVIRRLERAAKLAHRPLGAMGDRPATGTQDRLAQAFWAAHLRRLDAEAAKVRPLWPSPGMAAKDPFGWRFAWALVLLVGVVVAGDDGWTRVRFGLVRPIDAALSAAGPDTAGFEVWMIPPTATGLGTLRLDPARTDEVAVPAGSILRASVAQGWGRARLVIGDQSFDLGHDADGSQQTEQVVTAGDRLDLRRRFRTLAHWSIRVIPDLAPVVAFDRPPGPSPTQPGKVQAAVTAKDDWGLSKVWLEIAAPELAAAPDPVRIDLPLSNTSTKPKSAKIEARLAEQGLQFSGLIVRLTARAEDSAGQQSASPPASFQWPDITFSDPLAAKLADLRKSVLLNPAGRDDAPAQLDEIAQAVPEPAVALDLALAKRDLQGPEPRVGEAASLMMGAALRLEALAQARLNRIFQMLGEQLDKAGDGPNLQALTKAYAQMLDAMLDQSQSGTAIALSVQQRAEIRRRLDRLAAQPRNKTLVKRLDALAQRLIQPLTPDGQSGAPDPLGRVGGDDGTTRVPGHGDGGKARALFDEIRSRAQDGQRPKPERDYLRRLIE